MTTLVVIAYPDQGTAEKARATVWRLQEELILQAEEVAVISRDPDGRYHVHTSHSGFSTAGGAIWGGFWGLLFGTLFLVPIAGWAMGAGLGALLGHLRDNSIDGAFQQQVRDHLQPGTSALFMMIQRVTQARRHCSPRQLPPGPSRQPDALLDAGHGGYRAFRRKRNHHPDQVTHILQCPATLET